MLSIERLNPIYQSYDEGDRNCGQSKYVRSLVKNDIDGASPNKFKHRPRKFFVDRNEIKSVFNQTPGKYHGFKNDFGSGGTFISEKPDKVFKWSLTNKKDLDNMVNYKDERKFSPIG